MAHDRHRDGPLEVPDAVAGQLDNGRVVRYPRDAELADGLFSAVAAHLGPGTLHTERSITAAPAPGDGYV